jgi:hypothetical protein
MPLSTEEYPKFPFTAATALKYTDQMESFHLAVGNLRCFDARLNTANKKPYFNFYDHNNNYISGVRGAHPYSELFWTLFYKIVPFLGDLSKKIEDAKTAADIDALRQERIRLVDLDNGEVVVRDEQLISPQIRAMIDNICFMSVYGHRSMLEARLPPGKILGFADYALKAARDNEAVFYESWKRHLGSRINDVDAGGSDRQPDRIATLLGSDNDDEAEESPAAAGAAPAAAGAAPAAAAAAPAAAAARAAPAAAAPAEAAAAAEGGSA